MRNSKKPIKFAHLKKLANQSTLNNSHVIEIKKASTIAFMTARNYLFVGWTDRERQREKTEDGEGVFFKGLANSCSWFNKVVNGQPSFKWTS